MLNITQYHRPRTIAEAVSLLAPNCAVIAGGTDLMVNPRYSRGVSQLIDVTNLDLAYLRSEDGWLKIGATTTMHEVEYSGLLKGIADGVLAKAAGTCGSPNIRNVGTIGGNICSSLPSGDTLTTLLILEAIAVIIGTNGQREIPLSEFFRGPAQNALSQELLIEVKFPLPTTGTRAFFYKVGRTEEDISVLNVAALLLLDETGLISKARLAAGAVAPTPVRALAVEEFLQGKLPNQTNFEAAAELLAAAISPISDQRASAAYRRSVTKACARRALENCLS